MENLNDDFECTDCNLDLSKIYHCEDCIHFIHNGDRCDETQVVCYISSEVCSNFHLRSERYNERI